MMHGPINIRGILKCLFWVFHRHNEVKLVNSIISVSLNRLYHVNELFWLHCRQQNLFVRLAKSKLILNIVTLKCYLQLYRIQTNLRGKLHSVFAYSSSGKRKIGKRSELTRSLPKSVRIAVHAAFRPRLLTVPVWTKLAQFQGCCLVVTPWRLDIAINLARDL